MRKGISYWSLKDGLTGAPTLGQGRISRSSRGRIYRLFRRFSLGNLFRCRQRLGLSPISFSLDLGKGYVVVPDKSQQFFNSFDSWQAY